jgi:exosortase F-associated protein
MIAILVVLLFSVRAFESFLFYDPFSVYFENDYMSGPLPRFETSQLLFGLSVRYFLNTVLSLGIIYLLFPDKKLLRFTSLLYISLFCVLLLIFFAIISFSGSGNNFALFYIRRFLIQPIFLLLFVPAFYYQLRVAKK